MLRAGSGSSAQTQRTTKKHGNKARFRFMADRFPGASSIIPGVRPPFRFHPRRTKLLALLLCALLLPVAALAQLRQIPDSARRGHIVHIQDTIVEVDGQRMRLSAAAQIRSRDNLFIVPMSLPPGALVKYTLDAMGQIHRIWVLTPEEAAAPDKPLQ
jgi:hypothetical protein